MPFKLTPLLAVGISLLFSACSGGQNSDIQVASRDHDNDVPWEQPVRKAICGPLDHPETALQGQVPLVDRLSLRSQEGYNCNMEMVGQWQGDGASWQMAWYDDCAYYDTRLDASRENQGVVVLDVSNTSNPHPTDYLETAGMLDPWESLKVHEGRGLLGGQRTGGPTFDLYDVQGDCRHPKLIASEDMISYGHEGGWGQDGMTYWAGSTSEYHPISIDDPTAPVELMSWAPNANGTHGMSTNADSTRGYFTVLGLAASALETTVGFVIGDITDVTNRVADPQIPIISEFFYRDGSETGQHTIPVIIKGKPYIIQVDEAGVSGKVCGSGLSPFAFARIVNIEDETSPKLASKLMLETHDPDNCPIVMADYPGQVLFGYDSHYCAVDSLIEPTVVGCSYFNSGIRIFDIRDPYYPREIAYFNPPAQLGKQSELAGSQHASGDIGGSGGANMTADWCSAQMRFVPEKSEVWTTCQDNGFMVLKITNGVWPFQD